MDTQQLQTQYTEKTLNDNPSAILEESLKLPLLSDEETMDLLHKAQNGDVQARNTLIEHNMKLIYKYAGIYSNKCLNIDLSDFITAGCFGIIRAIELFNFEAGVKFSTYAVPWIKQYMRRMIANDSNTIRLPVHLQESKYIVTKAINDYYLTYKKHPDDYELLEYMNSNIEEYKPQGYNKDGKTKWDMDKVRKILSTSNYTSLTSLNTLVSKDEKDDDELLDFIQDEAPTPEQIFMHDDRTQDILRIIHRYVPDERARRMIFNKYGFNSRHEGMTLDAIGQMEGVTRERVRQIIEKNLKRIKDSGALDVYRQDFI